MNRLLLVALAYMAAPTGAAGQAAAFRGLHELHSVTTSRDEYGIWLTVPAVGYRLPAPGTPSLGKDHRARLTTSMYGCR